MMTASNRETASWVSTYNVQTPSALSVLSCCGATGCGGYSYDIASGCSVAPRTGMSSHQQFAQILDQYGDPGLRNLDKFALGAAMAPIAAMGAVAAGPAVLTAGAVHANHAKDVLVAGGYFYTRNALTINRAFAEVSDFFTGMYGKSADPYLSPASMTGAGVNYIILNTPKVVNELKR